MTLIRVAATDFFLLCDRSNYSGPTPFFGVAAEGGEGMNLVPEGGWNLDPRQLDRGANAVGAGHADDGRGDPRIAGRELEGGGGERDAVAVADVLKGPGSLDHLRRRLLVGVARVGVRSFGEDAAAVGGGVEDGESAGGGDVEERIGVAVEEGVAVVGNDGVESAGFDVPDFKV